MSVVLMEASDMRRTLGRLAHEILEANNGAEDLAVLGILQRGWPIAKRLAFVMTQIEGTTVPCAKLDARPFRDDRGPRVIPATQVDESEIPFDLNGKKVVLVDEVIFTGRTVRAALDATMFHGRPKEVQLAVLIDRGHRELPIAPNFCGRVIFTDRTDHVSVLVNEYDDEDKVILQKTESPIR